MRRRHREARSALGSGWRLARYFLVFLAGVLVAWWFWSGTASAQEDDLVSEPVAVVEEPTAAVQDVVGTVTERADRAPVAPVVEVVEPVAEPIVETVVDATAPVADRVGAVAQPVVDAVPPVPTPPIPPVSVPTPPVPPVVPAATAPWPSAGTIATGGAPSTTSLFASTAALAVTFTDAAADSYSPAAVATVASTARKPSPVVLTPGTRGGMRGPAVVTDLVATEVPGGGAASPTGSTTDPVGPASHRVFALPSGSSGWSDDGPRLLAVMAAAAVAAAALSRLLPFAVVPVSIGGPRPFFTPD